MRMHGQSPSSSPDVLLWTGAQKIDINYAQFDHCCFLICTKLLSAMRYALIIIALATMGLAAMFPILSFWRNNPTFLIHIPSDPAQAGGVLVAARLGLLPPGTLLRRATDPLTLIGNPDSPDLAVVDDRILGHWASGGEAVLIATWLARNEGGFRSGLAASARAWEQHPEAIKDVAAACAQGWAAARSQPNMLVEAMVESGLYSDRATLLTAAEQALVNLRPPLDRAAITQLAQAYPNASMALHLADQTPFLPKRWLPSIGLGTGAVALLILAAWKRPRRRRGPSHRLTALSEVQRRTMPPPPLVPGWELGLHWSPQSEVGGDFYIFATLGDGRRLTALGDVAGHGIGPALVATVAMKAGCLLAPRHATLGEWIASLARNLTGQLPSGSFITLVALALDTADGTAEVACAGHPPALLMHQGVCREVGRAGPAIGLFRQAEWHSETCQLAPGCELLLYTDGATEISDRGGRELGSAGLTTGWQSVQGGPAQLRVDTLAEHALMHGSGRREDDLTLILMHRLP